MKNKFLALSLLAMSSLVVVASCNKPVDKDSSSNDSTSNESVDSSSNSSSIDSSSSSSNEVEPGMITLSSSKTEIDMGKTLKIRATVSIPNAKVIWSSSDENVATVDKNGVVLGKDVTKDTKVTITAKLEGHPGVSASIDITVKYVIKEGTVFITSISKNDNFVLHAANQNLEDGHEDKFINSTKTHLVGDDNPIDVKPISIFKQMVNGKLVETNYKGEWDYKISISMKGEDGNYAPITETSSLVEKIDTKNCTIDFSENAINKSFKVRLEPNGLTDAQKAVEDYEDVFVANYNFDVIDGYNVYDAKDFSLIENRNSIDAKFFTGTQLMARQAWVNLKKTQGVNENLHPETLILQKNIEISDADLPTSFFWQADEVGLPGTRYIGSLKDNIMIYNHYTNNDKEFNLFGNYFTINAENLSLIKADANEPTAEDKVIVPESELIRFTPLVDNGTLEINPETNKDKNGVAAPDAFVKDVKFLGNSSKNESVKDSGGVILCNAYMNTTFDNVITRRWYQTLCMNNVPMRSLKMLNTKAKDNYTSFIYTEGAKEVLIENSVLDSCGGPAIIAQDVTHNNTTHEPVNVMINNSSVTSYVNGTEGWFQGLGVGDAIREVTQLDALLNAVNRSFLSTSKSSAEFKYFNFICLHMNSALDFQDIMGGKVKPIAGSIGFDNQLTFDMYNSKDPYFNGLYQEAFMKNGAPLLRSNYVKEEGNTNLFPAFGYYDGSKLMHIDSKTPIVDPVGGKVDTNSELFKGDKIAVYALGFMLTLDYHEANHEIA